MKLQFTNFTLGTVTLKIPDNFFASKVALRSPEPPLIVTDLLTIMTVPFPVNVFPFRLMVSPDFALLIELWMLLNVFPLGLILDFRELSSELIELKLGLESPFKLDNSFIDPTQSSSSLLFTILSLISSFKFVKEDSDCESIATELKLKSSKSVALTVENVKNTQRIIQIKHIIFNFNVHNTS